MLKTLEQLLGRLSQAAGIAAAVLFLAMVAVVAFNVVARYFFSQVWVGLQELEWHLFSASFLLAIPYALHVHAHVRVDLFYEGWSPGTRAVVDLLGVLLFLLPFCLLLIWYGQDFAASAFAINEGSGDPGGLPARWIIKSMIPLSALLSLLAGVEMLLRDWRVLRGETDPDDESGGVSL